MIGSDSELEVGSFFHNVQEAEPISTTLYKMGHTQPATPMQPDNYNTNRHCKQYSTPKTITTHGHDLLLDSRSNQTRPFTCVLEICYGKPGKLFYQTPPTAPPYRDVANIPPYRSYPRKIFCGVVFITRSYSKPR